MQEQRDMNLQMQKAWQCTTSNEEWKDSSCTGIWRNENARIITLRQIHKSQQFNKHVFRNVEPMKQQMRLSWLVKNVHWEWQKWLLCSQKSELSILERMQDIRFHHYQCERNWTRELKQHCCLFNHHHLSRPSQGRGSEVDHIQTTLQLLQLLAKC